MQDDHGSVGSGLTPLVPSPSASGLVAQPSRVQLSRATGWKMPPNTVKVDRSSGFGNPFPVSKGTATSQGVTRACWSIGTWSGPAMWFRDSEAEAVELAVRAFRAHFPPESPLAERARLELRGKNLACWCKPGSPCHAEVLLELANSPEGVATTPTADGEVRDARSAPNDRTQQETPSNHTEESKP